MTLKNQAYLFFLGLLSLTCAVLSAFGAIAALSSNPGEFHLSDGLMFVPWVYSFAVGYFCPMAATGYLIANQHIGLSNLYMVIYDTNRHDY